MNEIIFNHCHTFYSYRLSKKQNEYRYELGRIQVSKPPRAQLSVGAEEEVHGAQQRPNAGSQARLLGPDFCQH